MKTLSALISAVAMREGKKNQASIGDVREIFGHLTDICAENAEAYGVFAAQVAKKIKPAKSTEVVGLAKKKAKKKVAKKKVAKKAKKK